MAHRPAFLRSTVGSPNCFLARVCWSTVFLSERHAIVAELEGRFKDSDSRAIDSLSRSASITQDDTCRSSDSFEPPPSSRITVSVPSRNHGRNPLFGSIVSILMGGLFTFAVCGDGALAHRPLRRVSSASFRVRTTRLPQSPAISFPRTSRSTHPSDRHPNTSRRMRRWESG